MKTIQHTISAISTQGRLSTATVTLPAPPWGTLEADERKETAPRLPTIRDKGYRPHDDKGLRLSMYAVKKEEARQKDYDAALDLVDIIRP